MRAYWLLDVPVASFTSTADDESECVEVWMFSTQFEKRDDYVPGYFSNQIRCLFFSFHKFLFALL